MENDKLKKEFGNKLYDKDEIIEKLKKQLSEKQSEMDFQVIFLFHIHWRSMTEI